jgi:hypothetical protein
MIWYLVAFVAGMVVGGGLIAIFAWKNVRMYRVLWKNEKAGNVVMSRRLAAIEDERMALDEDEGDD